MVLNKRGMKHVEVILSFLIFIVAVGFALYFFSPFSNDRVVNSYLDYTFREIDGNTSVRVDTFSISVNSGASPPNTIAINLSDVNQSLHSWAKEYGGNPLYSSREVGGDLVYVESPLGWNGIDFILVRFSEEFTETTGMFAEHEESYYDIASYDTDELMSEKKLLDLNKSYYEDYQSLKDSFNIVGANFGFSLVFANDVIISEKPIPEGLDVFSESKRIEVLRKNGEIVFADFSVKVW